MNKQKIQTLLFASLTALFVVGSTFTNALSLTVTCSATDCVSNPLNGKLFNETDMKPGYNAYGTVVATNTSGTDLTFAVEVTRYIDMDPALGDVFFISVKEIESGITIIGPITVTAWKNMGYALLSSIPAGASRTYEFKVTMDPNAGNEYQNKQLVFDLGLGFDATPGVLPTPTPTPTNTPIPTPTNTPIPTPTGSTLGERVTVNLTPTNTPTNTPVPTKKPTVLAAQVLPETGFSRFVLYTAIGLMLFGGLSVVIGFAKRKKTVS